MFEIDLLLYVNSSLSCFPNLEMDARFWEPPLTPGVGWWDNGRSLRCDDRQGVGDKTPGTFPAPIAWLQTPSPFGPNLCSLSAPMLLPG